MQAYRTPAILLRRVNYAEADRIITLLTPDHGVVSAIAKGVRKSGSKLAGGLELFALCDLTILPGKSGISTITSARLVTFYGNGILQDYERMQLAYECIKQVNRATATVAEADFYYLLADSLSYLAQLDIDWRIVEVWFRLRLATLLGVAPNLATTAEGHKLRQEAVYDFDFAAMSFVERPQGRFRAPHITFLRLANAKNPVVLTQVSGTDSVLDDCVWLARALNG